MKSLMRPVSRTRHFFIFLLLGAFLWQSTAGLIHTFEAAGSLEFPSRKFGVAKTGLPGAVIPTTVIPTTVIPTTVIPADGILEWAPELSLWLDFGGSFSSFSETDLDSETELRGFVGIRQASSESHHHDAASCSICDSLHFSRLSIASANFDFPLPGEIAGGRWAESKTKGPSFILLLPAPRGPPTETSALGTLA